MPLPARRDLMKRLAATLVLVPVLLLLAGCGNSKDETTATATACTPDKLPTKTAGTLTVATDKPAYPPYFEDDEPANGEGFESAVAYAIGKQLGYKPAQVKWTVEPFNSSYAPGPKDFDFDVNEISITPPRQKVVDFSSPYYTNPQSVIVAKDSPLANAKSLTALKSAKIGVQIGTTSLDAVNSLIKPSSQPDVFNTSNDVV